MLIITANISMLQQLAKPLCVLPSLRLSPRNAANLCVPAVKFVVNVMSPDRERRSAAITKDGADSGTKKIKQNKARPGC